MRDPSVSSTGEGNSNAWLRVHRVGKFDRHEPLFRSFSRCNIRLPNRAQEKAQIALEQPLQEIAVSPEV